MEKLTLRNLSSRQSLITIAKVYIPGLLLLALIATYSLMSDLHFDVFSRDPIQLLNGKPYYGVISNIGIILWCTTSAVLLFSARLSSRIKDRREKTLFLLWGGILSIILLADDLFLIHDVIFPEYFNIDEKVFYVLYGFAGAVLFYAYRKIIIDSDYLLLILSFAFLGSSIITDVALLLGLNLTYPFVIEDSLKFLGIISWSAFFTRTAYYSIRELH